MERLTTTLRPAPTTSSALPPTLAREEWEPLARRHEQRVAPWVEPHLARRRTGASHPVEDFLFTYYSFRPAALRRWHPGHGVVIVDAEEHRSLKGYVEVAGHQPGVTVADRFVHEQQRVLSSVHTLLTATERRPPTLGCLGLHEWAMVYRLAPGDVRHSAWPLRLGGDGTDAVVESHRIGCSHFDAFRFFTEAARPRNTLSPGRDDRPAFEQPGCLHAGMDLYKHAFRLSPMVRSDLVADCFELAREIRVLDMRASPYDLAGLGYEPVRIETPQGKQEYVAAQRDFAERGRPLRRRLIEECERLLEVAQGTAQGPAT